MTKSHTCYPPSSASSPSSSKLGIETNSHMISKLKPKIRIIHVYAPEIIKTDAANFRELVQRLTGKPEDKEEGGGRRRRKRKTPPTKLDPLMDFQPKKRMIMDEEEEEFMRQQNGIGMIKNIEQDREEEEEDEYVDDDEMLGRSRSNGKFSGGFFDGFSELDGFMEELSTMPVL